MSPTMEKGGVADWKFKEGDSFNSGDVLLEVETDKAQIDVEAQDDGVVIKILEQNGAKDLPVGVPIAIIGEPGDDPATVELPIEKPSASAKETKSEPEPKKEEPKESKKPAQQHSTDSISSVANPKQVFFPSVASLLTENNISRAEALSNIKATGSNGRIVKGDVLAFLGKITQESLDKVTSFIQKNTHLDLSGVQKLKITPKESPKETAKDTKDDVKASKPKPEPKVITKSFNLDALVELQATSQEKGFEPFTIRDYIIAASERAERFAYQVHPQNSVLYDPIFEDLVTPTHNTERFKIKLDLPTESAPKISRNPLDAVDFFHEQDDLFSSLTSHPSTPSSFSVSVTVDPKVLDADEKANLYLEKLEHYIYDLQ